MSNFIRSFYFLTIFLSTTTTITYASEVDYFNNATTENDSAENVVNEIPDALSEYNFVENSINGVISIIYSSIINTEDDSSELSPRSALENTITYKALDYALQSFYVGLLVWDISALISDGEVNTDVLFSIFLKFAGPIIFSPLKYVNSYIKTLPPLLALEQQGNFEQKQILGCALWLQDNGLSLAFLSAITTYVNALNIPGANAESIGDMDQACDSSGNKCTSSPLIVMAFNHPRNISGTKDSTNTNKIFLPMINFLKMNPDAKGIIYFDQGLMDSKQVEYYQSVLSRKLNKQNIPTQMVSIKNIRNSIESMKLKSSVKEAILDSLKEKIPVHARADLTRIIALNDLTQPGFYTDHDIPPFNIKEALNQVLNLRKRGHSQSLFMVNAPIDMEGGASAENGVIAMLGDKKESIFNYIIMPSVKILRWLDIDPAAKTTNAGEGETFNYESIVYFYMYAYSLIHHYFHDNGNIQHLELAAQKAFNKYKRINQNLIPWTSSSDFINSLRNIKSQKPQTLYATIAMLEILTEYLPFIPPTFTIPVNIFHERKQY